MLEVSPFILSLFSAMSVWEACAVLLAIAYLLLAMRENILCWYCALLSTAIFTFLFWDLSLLMEAALNVYYMIMAVYGWQQWKFGGHNKSGVLIRELSGKENIIIIVIILAATLVSGYLLGQHTNAAWPYVDSFTTWGSVVTTIMVAKKYLENWLYWIVIDAISIPLYIDRGLYLTAILFVAYILIAVIAYLNWRQRFIQQSRLAAYA